MKCPPCKGTGNSPSKACQEIKGRGNHMKKSLLTQLKVSATQLDLVESELSNSAIFSRETGTIIDLLEAKKQVRDLNNILPKGTTIETLEKEYIQYLELYI